MLRFGLAIAALLGLGALSADAREGMFTPEQLPALSEDLSSAGLSLDPSTLTELTSFPMGAVVSLGGCTGSFVSVTGLVVTNHHCARGSIQYNSTPENNYLEDGFLAQRFVDELPAAPGSRIYVTINVRDVTDEIRAGLSELERGRDVYSQVEQRKKALVADCEQTRGHRCQIASFFGGAQYKLIDRLEIRDIRLVYAPADSIGKYGGDIDNWRWPRHTGDFAFYRAYVGRDGRPADYDPNNVPFEPVHHLSVSSSDLVEGDFVMAIGYPGRTSRYSRLVEVRNTFDWQYPVWIDLLESWIQAIETNAPEGSDARIKYESRLAGLNNFMKNLGGQIEGAERVGLLARRAERETALLAWANAQASAEELRQVIGAMDALSEQMAAADRRDFWFDAVRRPQLLSAASRIYRLAKEREKPDVGRKPGYQDRDVARIRQSLQAIERRFDLEVDLAEWMVFLAGYLDQSAAARVAAFDQALGLGEALPPKAIRARLLPLYEATELGSLETRLALLDMDAATLEESTDPFMQLAVALYETEIALEEADEELRGRMERLRPAYVQAILDWQASEGHVAYPDANSTLRVTYGSVIGGSPLPGLEYEAFTRLEEIPDKDTGEAPFNAPTLQLEQIAMGEESEWTSPSLGTVPVNFLSDLDVTGGNSGSPTLNARGELVGLLFDGTLESVNSDWDYDTVATRAIHVDARYMLWVMDKVDGAQRVINELGFAPAYVEAEPQQTVDPAPAVLEEITPTTEPAPDRIEPVEASPTP